MILCSPVFYYFLLFPSLRGFLWNFTMESALQSYVKLFLSILQKASGSACKKGAFQAWGIGCMVHVCLSFRPSMRTHSRSVTLVGTFCVPLVCCRGFHKSIDRWKQFFLLSVATCNVSLPSPTTSPSCTSLHSSAFPYFNIIFYNSVMHQCMCHGVGFVVAPK